MSSGTRRSKRKLVDKKSTPIGFAAHTRFKLKSIVKNEEPKTAQVDIETLKLSFNKRPWILHDPIINSEKLDKSLLDKCFRQTQPDPTRIELDSAPVFHPTKEEFENTLQYIAKIRPVAEEYGICSIVPPDSWKPHIMENETWKNSRIHTRVQRIDELKNTYMKKELRKKATDGFEFECGPECTLQMFKKYAEDFEANYSRKQDILTDSGSSWENIEGEYWRIVQNPTEKVQVLFGHNLDTKVLGSGFPLISDSIATDQTEYIKSGWNLNKTPKLPGSLLAFESSDGFAGKATPRVDVGMCFSSLCWKFEEHYLYALNYLSFGASRIWYGVPGRYFSQCEAVLKKMFPEFSKHPKLFLKLVTQLPPSFLKSEGIPVYRCVQYPKHFILIFPKAHYSGFNTGFNVSGSVNLAPYDWLPYGQLSVEIYSELCRKTSISYDKLLIDGCNNTVKSSWLLKIRRDSEEWKNACGSNGWLTRALKSRVKRERLRREFLCNASQSRIMDKDFGSKEKKECSICYYDLYLSATSCSCSSDKYTCLEHSKQLCYCPWSSREFIFKYTIDELNLLIDALEGKLNALHKWANENRQLFLSNREDKL